MRDTDHAAVLEYLRALEAPPAERAAPATSGQATGFTGGPWTSDAWGTRAAPSPTRLVEAYKSIVFACVGFNMNGVARTPLRLYAASGGPMGPTPRSACGPVRVNGRRLQFLRSISHDYVARSIAGASQVDEVTKYPLLDTLDDPNPEFDRYGLIAYWVACMDVVGTSYTNLVPGPFGPPGELWPLQPQYVYPVRKPGLALIDSYRYFNETWPAEQVLKIQHTGLRDPYGTGYAPTQAAFSYAGLEDRWINVAEQVLGTGQRPSLIWTAADPANPPGDDERKRYEAELNRKLAGPGEGKSIVTNGAFTPHEMNFSPADLGGKEIGMYAVERTANCFGTPMPFLTGETNLANLQAAEAYHAKHAVLPRCHRIASGLTRLVKRYDSRLFFAFDNPVNEDELTRARVLDLAVNKYLEPNEVRLELGYEPKPWGDEPWISSTLRQPSEERPQPPAAAPPAKPQQTDPEASDDGQDDDRGDDARRGALLDQLGETLRALEGRVAGEGEGEGEGGRDAGAGADHAGGADGGDWPGGPA